MQAKPKSVKKPESPESSVVSGGSNPSGVIYIDQDSDITSIVGKVRSEAGKDIKLVVPKNSSALKSGVNLKLLARTAHNKSKNLSLITSDSKLIAMAAAAKIATAPNLSAEASLVGAAALNSSKSKDLEDESSELEEDLTIDGSEFSAPLAASPGKNSDLEPDISKKEKKQSAKSEKSKKVPNFTDFRKKALIGIGAFLAVILILLLFMTSRKSAVLEIRANAERLDVNFAAKLNEAATETTAEELKAVKKSGSKSVTETTPATGEQDIGAKAGGKLTLSIPCSSVSGGAPTVSSGTTVTSNGLAYVTQSAATLDDPTFSGGCRFTGQTTILAANAGTQYNLASGSSFKVNGSSTITGQGSAITGGTTQIVKVVSQADVNTLNEKLAANNQQAYKEELRSQFNDSQKILDETFSVQLGDAQLTPAVGQQAEQLSATVVVNYSMFGVSEEELEKILEIRIKESKTEEAQGIVKNGIDELKLSAGEDGLFNFSTVAFLGPKLDEEKIKQEVAGKKKGEAIQFVESQEGVNNASVKISPFWGSSLPGADKIEIKIEISDAT
jgi:cell division protein FtsL